MRIGNSKHFRVAGQPRRLLTKDDAPEMREIAGRASGLSESLRRKRNAGKAKVQHEGCCRMCQRPASVRPLTRHHLVSQYWFRRQPERIRDLRNCDACIVPLCRPCHDSVEGVSNLPNRRLLRRVLVQEEIAFCIQLRGKEWFDKTYPSVRVVSS